MPTNPTDLSKYGSAHLGSFRTATAASADMGVDIAIGARGFPDERL
jgi:hypothetical protein